MELESVLLEVFLFASKLSHHRKLFLYLVFFRVTIIGDSALASHRDGKLGTKVDVLVVVENGDTGLTFGDRLT